MRHEYTKVSFLEKEYDFSYEKKCVPNTKVKCVA